MRRAHAADAAYQHQQHDAVEQENEQLVDGLSDKIKALKSLSIDIGTEVREQNRFLNEMDNDFDSSGGILKATMGRLTAIAKAGHHNLIFKIILFALFVFFILWVIIKTR